MKESSPCFSCRFESGEVVGGLIGPKLRYKCGDKFQLPLEPGTTCSKKKEKTVFGGNSRTSVWLLQKHSI